MKNNKQRKKTVEILYFNCFFVVIEEKYYKTVKCILQLRKFS